MCKVLHCCDIKFHEYEQEADPEVDTNNEPVYHLVLDFSDDCEALNTDKLVVEQPSADPPVRRPPHFYGNRVNLSAQTHNY